MRVFLFPSAVLLALSACDSGPGGAALCFVDFSDDGGFSGHVLMPTSGDTLRVGEPFLLRAEVEADPNVTEIGIELAAGSFGNRTAIVLFRQVLTSEVGHYTLERTVVMDSLSAPLPLDARLSFGIYGVYGFADCGGVGGARSATYVAVEVEE